MTCPVSSLSSIRKARETDALRTLTRAQDSFEKAETEFERLRQDHEAFVRNQRARKDEIIAKMKEQPVKLGDIRLAQHEESRLAAHERTKAEQVLQAKQQVEDSKQALTENRLQYQRAAKQSEKLRQYKEILEAEARRAAEKAAEEEASRSE